MNTTNSSESSTESYLLVTILAGTAVNVLTLLINVFQTIKLIDVKLSLSSCCKVDALIENQDQNNN